VSSIWRALAQLWRGLGAASSSLLSSLVGVIDSLEGRDIAQYALLEYTLTCLDTQMDGLN
jgi:hypothetical protein